MSAAQHTPGPWHTGGHAGVEMVIYDKEGWAIADARPYHSKRTFSEAQANASLIAAAPDLLDLPNDALLREVLGYIEDAGPADVWAAAQAWMAKRDALVAKATGGAS